MLRYILFWLRARDIVVVVASAASHSMHDERNTHKKKEKKRRHVPTAHSVVVACQQLTKFKCERVKILFITIIIKRETCVSVVLKCFF